MKRIKNWFDSFDGDYKDMEYRLNGGKTMNNWVESTLNKEREAIKKPKEIKSKTGLSNQFIKTHNNTHTPKIGTFFFFKFCEQLRLNHAKN